MQRADQELARLRQALVQAWTEIAELRVLADHDSLTGLFNRRRMMAELEDVVEDCRRHVGEASLVFLDLNRLKMLTDSHGHQAGDDALVNVERIIHESLNGGFVDPFQGEEFAVFFRNLPELQTEEN